MPAPSTCPAGHPSEWSDYCSVCGAAMEVMVTAESCPQCGDPRIGPFCEGCGHSYDAGALPATSSWCALIAPDQDYFAASMGSSAEYTFPASTITRSVVLGGVSMRIGRHSSSRGLTPEIDLGIPPRDPGVSREHAMLLAQPDGGWALVDVGSMNGTFLNGGTTRIPVEQEIPVNDGDRVHLGAWTTITLRRTGPR